MCKFHWWLPAVWQGMIYRFYMEFLPFSRMVISGPSKKETKITAPPILLLKSFVRLWISFVSPWRREKWVELCANETRKKHATRNRRVCDGSLIRFHRDATRDAGLCKPEIPKLSWNALLNTLDSCLNPERNTIIARKQRQNRNNLRLFPA